jgi:Ca2+-transporting ATPase
LLLGIVVPTVLKNIEDFYFIHSRKVGLDFGFLWYLFEFAKLTVPILVLFYGMSMFYVFAPRRRTQFREVWSAALFVTIALEVLQRVFILYTRNIGHFNALYGTFGTVIALLLWIYLSGSIIILGGCLSAAKYEIEMSLTDQAESSRPRD